MRRWHASPVSTARVGLGIVAIALLGACTTSARTESKLPRSTTTTTTTSSRSGSPTSTTTTAPPTTDTTSTISVVAETNQPPTAKQIAAQVATTHEVDFPDEGFTAELPTTVGDGGAGFLTAVPALRSPSADGHGWLVFFWHNQTFLGWDTDQETWNVGVEAATPRSIQATY